MLDAKTCRRYADECMRLARSLPQDRDKLVEMAAMWQRLADAAEREAGRDRA